jgi:hypothetical protein
VKPYKRVAGLAAERLGDNMDIGDVEISLRQQASPFSVSALASENGALMLMVHHHRRDLSPIYALTQPDIQYVSVIERVPDKFNRIVTPLHHLYGSADEPLNIFYRGTIPADRQAHLTLIDYKDDAPHPFINNTVSDRGATYLLHK